MTHDLVYRLKASQPTLDHDQCVGIMAEMLTSDKYVLFSSPIVGLDNVLNMAEIYIKSLARVDLGELGDLLTFQPLHVLHYKTQTGEHWGLLYSNGLVLYSEVVATGITALLMMTKELAKENNLDYHTIRLDQNGA